MIKKILTITVIAIILTGCSKASVMETDTYYGNIGGVEMIVELQHSDDILIKQTSENSLNYIDNGFTKVSAEETVNKYKSLYNIEGVTYKAEVTQNSIKEKIIVDFEKADIDDLKRVGLILIKSKDRKVYYVSYKATVQNLERIGLKEL